MKKRFTDADIWKKAWFRKLSPTHKILFNYIKDNCDQAGVWEVDFEMASMCIGDEVIESDLSMFGDRILKISSDKVILVDFVSFQNGLLTQDCRPHRPIISLLEKHNLEQSKETKEVYPIGYQKKPDRVLDSVSDTLEVKVKVKVPVQEEVKVKVNKPEFDFESVYQKFPKKVGKEKGLSKLRTTIKTDEQFKNFVQAVENYSRSVIVKNTSYQYQKQFDTFIGCWTDWINPDPREFIKISTKSNNRFEKVDPMDHYNKLMDEVNSEIKHE